MRKIATCTVWALGTVLAARAPATTYSYTIKSVTPTYGSPSAASRDYGAVTIAAGNILSQGTLTTSAARNALSTTACQGRPSCFGNTITGMTGSFLNVTTSQYEAITFSPNPIAPEYFGTGNFLGDSQLLPEEPTLLDEGGIIFSTPSTGFANLLGFPYYLNNGASYEIFDSKRVPAPTRSGTAGEHYYVDFAVMLAEDKVLQGGTATTPIPLPKLAVSQISAQIGPDNPEQFYKFHWDGGATPFTTTASVTGAQSDYKFKLLLSGAHFQGQTVTLDTSNNFTGGLKVDLPKGNYSIGLIGSLAADPAFTLTFGSPLAGSVPEPASWLTMLAGFGMIGGVARRARKTAYAGHSTGVPNAPAP